MEKYDFNKCENYILNKLYNKSLPDKDKIRIILNRLTWRYMLLGTWWRIAKSSLGQRLGLPDWPILKADTFTSESLRMLDKLKSDVLNSEKGQAFFAHIMLPHHPYHFDSECRLNRIVPEKQGEADYFAQLKCVQKTLGEFVRLMDENNMLSDSIIVIHGDHGSRIINPQPALNSPPSKNYISWHSVFFAVHMPAKIKSKYDIDPVSVSELLANIHDYKYTVENDTDEYVYIQPNGKVPHDYKFKRSLLPPFWHGEIVKNW